MNIRKNIWPKVMGDGASMFFILTMVPLVYWYKLWFVIPELFQPGSLEYYLHFLFGNFIMINIVGNFTYTVLCDTSIRTILITNSINKLKNGWRFCSSCEAVTPPRSWHCQTCNTCILKRDHHCIFTGCCIGHNNHRYFTLFVFYLFIGTLYSFIYNNYFIWDRINFEFPRSIIKITFPLAIFMFGFDNSFEQIYLIFYLILLIGMLFTGVLSIYHINLILNGTIAHEYSKDIKQYNLGWKNNFKIVFGKRWYLALILPYVSSELPHDGVHWDCKSSPEYIKNR